LKWRQYATAPQAQFVIGIPCGKTRRKGRVMPLRFADRAARPLVDTSYSIWLNGIGARDWPDPQCGHSQLVPLVDQVKDDDSSSAVLSLQVCFGRGKVLSVGQASLSLVAFARCSVSSAAAGGLEGCRSRAGS
jgi:hypothetical protein